ncbi:ArnT family glycosyltransferase [Maribacter sp. 2304DJ31-5]|uniref:ArnT family glycosyltransferase n=1 Tax=Maribacter sp. 2304DJ31-5 TaxID=3386273 RepID=UPI0039BC24CB
MLEKIPKPFFYFLTVFLVFNLIQASFTELIFDEAYYWYYSQNMAWGYFDHPPMVALLIKISALFFNGELGVRFIGCLLSAGNVIILWSLIDNPRKNEYIPHFFVLVFSMTLLNAYGFFTLPDTPLLFFTSCFLLSYKRFIEKPTLLLAIALGVIMAALMYSKYHAVLVILFVLLSNLNLVKNKYAWLAVCTALLCYIPHFYWLYANDFVSIKYHLYERPNGAYSFEKYTLGFFVNLIALFGLTFPFIYYALIKTRSKELFTRALLFLTYGIILFFFVSSFNRRIQTQWVVVISIPLAIIAFNFMLRHKQSLKWIYRLGTINIILMLYLRAGLIYQPLLFNFYYESHGNKDWVKKVADKAGAIPVVFENSYRRAPMYAFYSGGKTSFSLNNVQYRKNQYTIDGSEEQVRGKKILYISKYMKSGPFSYTKTDGSTFYGKFIDDFKSYRNLECTLTGQVSPITIGQSLDFKVYNPYNFDIPMKELQFAIAYLDAYRKPRDIRSITAIPNSKDINYLKAKDSIGLSITLPSSKKENLANFRIVISENNLYFGLNGKPIPLN